VVPAEGLPTTAPGWTFVLLISSWAVSAALGLMLSRCPSAAVAFGLIRAIRGQLGPNTPLAALGGQNASDARGRQIGLLELPRA